MFRTPHCEDCTAITRRGWRWSASCPLFIEERASSLKDGAGEAMGVFFEHELAEGFRKAGEMGCWILSHSLYRLAVVVMRVPQAVSLNNLVPAAI